MLHISATSRHSSPKVALMLTLAPINLMLALLGVVVAAWPWATLLRWRGDKEEARVAFGGLFTVLRGSPQPLPCGGASIVRVGHRVGGPGRLVAEATLEAVVVARGAGPASSGATTTTGPAAVCGAYTWHVGPFGHHLRTRPTVHQTPHCSTKIGAKE